MCRTVGGVGRTWFLNLRHKPLDLISFRCLQTFIEHLLTKGKQVGRRNGSILHRKAKTFPVLWHRLQRKNLMISGKKARFCSSCQGWQIELNGKMGRRWSCVKLELNLCSWKKSETFLVSTNNKYRCCQLTEKLFFFSVSSCTDSVEILQFKYHFNYQVMMKEK